MQIKKVIALILTVLLILLCACKVKNSSSEMPYENSDGIYGTHISEQYRTEIDLLKNEFSKSDDKITKDTAVSEGMAVILPNSTAIKGYKVKAFCDSVVEKKPAQLRIAVFDKNEENVIIKVIKYDGNKIYGYFDMRGYSYSQEEYLDFEYPYCELYENKAADGNKINYMMYMTDNDYTLEEVMNIMSDTEDGEKSKCVYVCSYTE